MDPLDSKKSALLVVDVQEKLFPLVAHPTEMLDKLLTLIDGCQIMHLPILISEQYPKGLGSTIEAIRQKLAAPAPTFSKTSFSCLKSPEIAEAVIQTNRSQWIVAGIEAHVCIFQTARSLLQAGKQVVVVNDAISARSIYDFSTAIAELRDLGARISSTETVLFELLGDSTKPEFKALSQLIKG